MPQFLVTVKLPRKPEHDPFNKQTGECPVSGRFCSDITGQHHTVLIEAIGSREAAEQVGHHITRIEEV